MIIGGGVGTCLGLVCCLTPLLPALFGAGAITGFFYRDAILLPFAAMSLLVMLWGLYLARRGQN